MALSKEERRAARGLLKFIDASPTPFHAVEAMRARLEPEGFRELREGEEWELAPGDRVYVTRGGSTLAAMVVGRAAPEAAGFRLVGSHTDSPNLRLKPRPEFDRAGYRMLGVEVYGGALLASWTDRDLSIAGRVALERPKRGLESVLVRVDRPLMRIPQLAIHLNREVNTAGLVLNKQTQLPPVYAQAGGAGALEAVAAELGVKPDRVAGFDLMLYDTQPSALWGAGEEFIAAPRIDNLFCAHAGLEALLAAAPAAGAAPEATLVAAAFDNEEIGSATTQGARSSFLRALLGRTVAALGGGAQSLDRALARSRFVSADMAHGAHPNYADRHDPEHFPMLNGGVVIKTAAGGQYATSGDSSAEFEAACRERQIPVQKFVVRSDMACGTTIGPAVSSELGAPGVDLGCAMWAMHSARESAGARDPLALREALAAWFARAPA